MDKTKLIDQIKGLIKHVQDKPEEVAKALEKASAAPAPMPMPKPAQQKPIGLNIKKPSIKPSIQAPAAQMSKEELGKGPVVMGQKGVHSPFEVKSSKGKITDEKGISHMGHTVRNAQSLKTQHLQRPENRGALINEAHSWAKSMAHNKINEARSMEKPNLPKSEMDKAEHQPHPGPSKSAHQKIHDAKTQSQQEAHLKSPKGDAERKARNTAVICPTKQNPHPSDPNDSLEEITGLKNPRNSLPYKKAKKMSKEEISEYCKSELKKEWKPKFAKCGETTQKKDK